MLKDPEAMAKFQSTVKIAPENSPLSGDAFRKQVLDDHAKWKAVVVREGIVAQ
jgi:hypothetical protein